MMMTEAEFCCSNPPFYADDFHITEIGIDETYGRFGEVTIQTCKSCQSKWLRYFVEYEAFSESGRWYRGLISDEVANTGTPETAVEILEGLDWFIRGGSYFKTPGQRGSGRVRVDL
jgi:hypothetical protein